MICYIVANLCFLYVFWLVLDVNKYTVKQEIVLFTVSRNNVTESMIYAHAKLEVIVQTCLCPRLVDPLDRLEDETR